MLPVVTAKQPEIIALYLDKNGIIFNGEPAAQVIARQVAVSDEGKLIDFVSSFSSSFSDRDAANQ